MFFHACLHVICLDLHALCFMPCFPMVCSSFCSMLMLGYMLTCLHDVVSYALLGSMCWYVYFHAIWLDPCFHMLICLDSCSSMLMKQACTCWCVCFYAYLSWSMFSHALYYLPCACAIHAMFVYLDLGYVCHAMCYCSSFVPSIAFSCILA